MPYRVTLNGTNFVLVDTPGFDDSDRTDRDILKTLIDWLESSYRAGSKLTGILYLHRISDPRMQGSSLRNLSMFKSLVGEDSFRNVVLATTFWSALQHDIETAEEREAELQDSDEFWGGMVAKGSDYVRLPTTPTAARLLLQRMAKRKTVPLKIQIEMVDENKSFEETTASDQFHEELRKVKEQHEQERAAQQARFQAEMQESEEKQRKEEEQRKREFEEKIREQEAKKARLLEEQRTKELEQQKQHEEAKRKQKEKLEKEEAEMAAKVARVKTSQVIHKRKQMLNILRRESQQVLELVKSGIDAKTVICRIEPASRPYSWICDNCFNNIGGDDYWGESCPPVRHRLLLANQKDS
jgi:hypothetical protein